ncbi:restriction endonuclease subunit S [Haemophilus influenzae]|uniref:restriction endonuclease subunit S n=1 Tax=Haemophilus influenzae TaxID=727 RepID=UPI000E56B873|nr:restriction endonuclease subunit S [Haemophilus influenzae]MDE4517724.1 restriction endonuclease subunit S [Haemophilus influenzae]
MNKVEFGALFLEPLRNGVTKPKRVRGSGYKMVNMGEIFSLSFIQNQTMDRVPLTDKEKAATLLQNNDLLFARQSLVRDGAGKCSIFLNDNEPVCFESHIIRVRLNQELCYPMFYYYFFSSRLGKNTMDKIIEQGAGAAGIRGSDLAKLEVPYIEYSKQKEIADSLYSFDQKIQLNTQINQTLELIAQALFKSWFVNFDPVRAKVQALSDGMSLEQAELAAMQAISGKTPEELTALSQTQPDRYAELAETAKAFPCEMVEVDGGEVPKGWEKTTLSEICEMQNGYAFKSSDWVEQGIPVIKIGSVKPIIVEVEGNGFVSEDYSKLKPDFLLTSGDILVGLTGYVGEVGRIPTGKIAMLNQRVAKFLPKEIDKNHCFYNYIYCLARQSQFKEFAEINAKGSAQANISTKELLKFPIIKANDKLHILFENRVKELLERILWNSQNAETLAKTRDLLLPRLLNGE